jgi:hypothetical protein
MSFSSLSDWAVCSRSSAVNLAILSSNGSPSSSTSAALRIEPGVLLLERVGDVLEEDQAQHDVLVLGRIHVRAQRVGSLPQFPLEPEVGCVSCLAVLFLKPW